MRDIIMILVASCVWIAAFYRFKIWKRASQQNFKLTLRFKYVWYFHVFLAGAVTLFYDQVARRLNAQLGLNNFSWLAAYLCGLAAFYTYNLFIYNAIHLPIKIKSRILRWQRYIWLISSVALTLIYWFYIRLSPEWPSRLPRSQPDVLFQLLFFSVLTGFCLTVARGTYLFIQQEQNKFFKFQTSLSLITIGAGMLCFVLKIIFVSLWLFFPASSQLLLINQLALLAMGIAGLLSLSNLIIIPMVIPIYHLIKAFFKLPAWFDLLDLQNKLYQHHLIDKPAKFSWLQYLAEPNYHMLKIIVSVLDAQRSQGSPGKDSPPSKRKLQEAISNLNQTLEYEELITACRKINQSLK